jgi:hypothetical protein
MADYLHPEEPINRFSKETGHGTEMEVEGRLIASSLPLSPLQTK